MRHVKADDSELCVCGSERIEHKHGASGVQIECKAKRQADAERWNNERTPRAADPTGVQRKRGRPRGSKSRTTGSSAVKREVSNAVKANTPCADCGVKYPSYVMDFDHVRGVKSFGLGQAVIQPVSIEDFIAEMDKCDVVCANCHRERTFGPNAHERVERETPYSHVKG